MILSFKQTGRSFTQCVGVLLLGCPLAVPVAANATQLVGDATVTVSGTVARIHWVTDVATGTRLEVSPEASVHLPADRTPTTDHVVEIDGLRAGTNYTIKLGTARLWLGTRSLSGANASEEKTSLSATTTSKAVPPARATWGNYASLPDHFARHGSDFSARNPEDYARMAWEFLQRAKAEGLPAKVDPTGTLRVFDPKSGAFAAYNRDGTTKTFFKPGSAGYFERQPGRPVNLRTWK